MATLEIRRQPPERSIPISWGMPRPSVTVNNPALVAVSVVSSATATPGQISPDLYQSCSNSLSGNGQKNLVVLFRSSTNPSQQIAATYAVSQIDPQLIVGETYLFGEKSLFPNGVQKEDDGVARGTIVYLDWDTSGPRGSKSFAKSPGEAVGASK